MQMQTQMFSRLSILIAITVINIETSLKGNRGPDGRNGKPGPRGNKVFNNILVD